MTAAQAWTSSDTRPRFKIAASNLIDEDEQAQDAWSRALALLESWSRDPSALEDDDSEAPSRETIVLATRLALEARKRGSLPPTRVMPNGEAGIALEWVAGSLRRLWEINDEHQVEMSGFLDARCTSSKLIDLSGLSL